MKTRTIKSVSGHSRIDGVVPGVKGQRAFPTRELRTVDPFIMLDHIGPQHVGASYFVDGRNSGHPHRGFETMTFLFEGNMNHVDSKGNRFELKSGSVQRMNAGKGIQHGGDFFADPIKAEFHEVQLWVNLPSQLKMSEPEIQNVSHEQFPVLRENGVDLKVVSGEVKGLTGPLSTKQPTQIAHGVFTDKAKITLNDIKTNYNLVIYALKGNFNMNGKLIHAEQAVVFENDGEEVELESLESGELLIAAGLPIHEPVVMGGPFVMNTTEEIDQAYSDFKAGLFGEIEYD